MARRTVLVPLSKITGGLRRTLDPGRSASIERAQTAGTKLPPVRLTRTSRGYEIEDGNHRVAAARASGQRSIKAIVERGVEVATKKQKANAARTSKQAFKLAGVLKPGSTTKAARLKLARKATRGTIRKAGRIRLKGGQVARGHDPSK